MPDPTLLHWLPRLTRIVVHSRTASICLVGVLSLIVGTMFVLVRIPQPSVHDEFSYLLAADTFLEGRLANPPHPYWEHFESIHIIQKPTYASKYQPGQGILLALGTVLSGYPIVGAVLGTALASAAVCWMLGGWMPNRWALVGGAVVALHHAILASWTLSYWGGSLPLLGGALMFGALPRLLLTPRAFDATLLAGGAIILAATRPYECFVVGVFIAVVLIWQLILKGRDCLWVSFGKIVLPAATVLTVGISGIAVYNKAVTGSPFTLPYRIHETSYGYSPLFLWQSPREVPSYRHEALRDFHTGWGIQDYQQQQTLTGFLQAKAAGWWKLGAFYLGLPLAIPLLTMPWLLINPRLRLAWAGLGVFLIAELAIPWIYPHYYAPIAPLLFLLIVFGLRYLRASLYGYPWGRLLVPALFCWQVALLGLLFVQYFRWQPEGWQWERARLVAQLQSTPDNDLVFVRYGSSHNPNAEWVYNRADIDKADIVWAREMAPDKNRRLIDYFADRNVWLLEADAPSPQLVPYQKSMR